MAASVTLVIVFSSSVPSAVGSESRHNGHHQPLLRDVALLSPTAQGYDTFPSVNYRFNGI